MPDPLRTARLFRPRFAYPRDCASAPETRASHDSADFPTRAAQRLVRLLRLYRLPDSFDSPTRRLSDSADSYDSVTLLRELSCDESPYVNGKHSASTRQ